jgi:hypothetical protein
MENPFDPYDRVILQALIDRPTLDFLASDRRIVPIHGRDDLTRRGISRPELAEIPARYWSGDRQRCSKCHASASARK